MYALLVAIGIFSGFSGSLVGLGGGFIVVPALAFLFPEMTPAELAGTSMTVLLFNSISSVYAYMKQKRIDYGAALRFAAFSIPGAVLGAIIAEHVGGALFFVSFGVFLMSVALLMLFKPGKPLRWPFKPTVRRDMLDAGGQRFAYAYHMPTGAVISLFVGVAASLFGVGGGSLMMPTMTLLLAFPAHVAVATSMLQILLSSIVSTATHALLANVEWLMVLFLAPGAMLGGQLGARLAKRTRSKMLLRVLAVLLFVVAIRLILKG